MSSIACSHTAGNRPLNAGDKPAPLRAQGTLGEVATGRKWQAKKIPLSAGKYRQRGKLSTPGLSMLKI